MRMTTKLRLGAAAIAAVLLPSNAEAAIVVYTITGSGSGFLAGNAFSNANFTFTLTGDTANYSGSPGANQFVDPLNNASFNIAGVGSGTFLIATRLGMAGSFAFFSRAGSGGLDLFDFETSVVDLTTTFGPISGGAPFALDQFQGVTTSAGDLSFDAAQDVSFAGALAGAVPEPTTWAMMIVGFGAVGASMRRRKTAVKFNFA